MGAESKDNNHVISKFLKVFIIAFVMLITVLVLVTVIYVQVRKGRTYTGMENNDDNDVLSSNGFTQKDGKTNEQKITTFAIFGVDQDGFRTDVIMLVLFNVETMDIDVISVPRDTKVRMPDEVYSEITSRRDDVTQIVKINEVAAYANSNRRSETTVAVLEDSFDIDVDYFVKMDLNGFKSIVDIVAPITVEIPEDMVYEDPYQDLYINLSKGVQPIYGAQAESLIRYRSGYDNADIGRIEMQKVFMKAFLDELLTLENKMNIVNIAAATMVYVDTDFENAIDYLAYIDEIKTENINFYTIPGEALYSNRSYFVYDYDDTKELFNHIINGTKEEIAQLPEEEIVVPKPVIDSRQLPISVQNGTNINGLAGETKELLASNGYNAVEAIDYEGEDEITRTKIITWHRESAEEIATYFSNPDIEVDESLKGKTIQIKIILGPEERR